MLTITEIEDSLKPVSETKNQAEYIKGLLSAYGIPSATLSRTDFSAASLANGIQIGRQALFVVDSGDLQATVDRTIEKLGRRKPTRFIIGLNDAHVLALDTILDETTYFERNAVVEHADFFLPFCGREKSTVAPEERIDAKIGSRMASLYNQIMMLNRGATGDSVLSFLVALIQLFATNSAESICEDQPLYQYLDVHTATDGSDLYQYLCKIMNAISGKEVGFTGIRKVNPRLFQTQWAPLSFNMEMRENIIELASMPWMQTQSDYMGQIMQSIIVDASTHITENYTTATNVHKVIDPLFMDELNKRFVECGNDTEKLRVLREDILNIWIFDPSCSAAEFLATSWQELNELLKKIGDKLGELVLFPLSHLRGITLSNKSLIVAKLNLYFVALKWTTVSGGFSIQDAIDCLETGNVVIARSLLTDWDSICKPTGKVYVVGNWPYAGARKMNEEQKHEVNTVFSGNNKHGDVDYAGAYFLKAVKYLDDKDGEIAFVTTNSLTQGKQVVELWPIIYQHNVYIRFAYQAFKWSNDARNQTTVTVVILGIAKNTDKQSCYLYTTEEQRFVKRLVKDISPYLVPGNQMVVDLRRPISKSLPVMVKGNMPYGAEFFSFTPEEKNEMVTRYPDMEKYLKIWIGADEMLGGKERWCLWIHDDEVAEARKIPIINERLNKCKDSRLNKTDKNAQKLAFRPHSFREQNETTTQSIAIPQLSSENYEFIPIDIYGPDVILTNLAFVIYDCDYWVFGVLASSMHNVWIRTVCGGFETRIRYSESLGYNTFPFPEISVNKKQEIRDCVDGIMAAREESYGLSLGEMYKRGQMSETLQQAHLRLDNVIDSCYRKEPFLDEQDRIYFLFSMYEQMKGEN